MKRRVRGPDINCDAESTAEQLPSDNKEYYFGCRFYHPKWLQVLAKKKVFSFLLCVLVVTQGSIVTGLTSVNVSNLEKRYSFNSAQAGLLVGMYDLSVAIGIICISYIGGKTHKPRVLGFCTIILSVGALIMASPQFLFGTYKSGSQLSYEGCMSSESFDDCLSTNIGAYTILVLGQVVIGIGTSGIYPIGIAFIDEIVYPQFVSLHFGTVLVCSVLGPAFGYLFGSLLLSVYVDPWIETDLDSTNPNWVGAWWIGLVIMGSFGLMLSVMFLLFPKWLPDSHLVRRQRMKEMAKVHSPKIANEDHGTTSLVKEFFAHMKDLLTNASFMLTCFAIAMLFVIKDSVITFGPKYVESMFRITATASGLIAGGAGIVAAATGVATGALIMHFWKPKGRHTTIVQLVGVFISLPFVLLFLIRCPSYNVAGITVPYADGSLNGKDSAICSMNCSCQSSMFEPICGMDGVTYFSPCRAGCDIGGSLNDGFENCTCIAEQYLNTSNLSGFHKGTAVDGLCPIDCNRLIPFLALIFLLVFLLFTIDIPLYYYSLRIVTDDQRYLALGLQSTIFRIFGSIPGPLLFGAVIDLACVEWEDNCGVRGNCWIYDNDRLGINALLLCLPFGIASVILLFLSMVFYPKKRSQVEDSSSSPN